MKGMHFDIPGAHPMFVLDHVGVAEANHRTRGGIGMTGGLAHIGPAMTAAFLASLVEAVEALTIVLAVATVRGWRPAGLARLPAL